MMISFTISGVMTVLLVGFAIGFFAGAGLANSVHKKLKKDAAG